MMIVTVPQSDGKQNRFYIHDRDFQIFKVLAQVRYATAEQLFNFIEGDHKSLIRRLTQLTRAEFLGFAQSSDFAPRVFYLKPKAIRKCQELGYLPEHTPYNPVKSVQSLNHDLAITDYVSCLLRCPHCKVVKTLFTGLRDNVKVDGEMLSFNPDAYLEIESGEYLHPIFVEMVGDRGQYDYSNGESSLLRRTRAALEYHASKKFEKKYGLEDFRYLTILPTEEKMTNFLRAIEQDLPYRKFICTTRKHYSQPCDVHSLIYFTPKDFPTRKYTLF